MARSKSRSGGRVTPKGTRPNTLGGRPQLAPEARRRLESMVQSAAELAASCPDANVADRWASGVQEVVSFAKSDGGLQPAQVLGYAREIGGAAGAAMTGALAVYGPNRERGRARRQLAQLAASGDAPSWATALGRATPVEAFLSRDEWGEECEVAIRYERPDGSRHILAVEIGWFMLGAARGLEFLAERDGSTAAESGSTAAESLSLADARALCSRAVELFSVMVVTEEFAINEALDFEGIDLGFLAEHRLNLLPEGGTDVALFPVEVPDRSAALDEFEHAERPSSEDDAEFAALLSGLHVFGLMCRDCDVLHWTPCRVQAFVEEFIADRSPNDGPMCTDCGEPHPAVFDMDFMSTVESAFPRWLRFAAEHSEPSMVYLEPNLQTAADGFMNWRATALEHGIAETNVPDLWLPRSA